LADQYERNRSLDFWIEPRYGGVDVRVTEKVYPSFAQALQERGIPFQITMDNVQEFVDQQIRRPPGPQAFDLLQYNVWSDIQVYLAEFVAAHSSDCQRVKVGTSYQGNTIDAVKITSNNSPKTNVIWIQAGIHAREWISPATCLWIMTKSLEDPAISAQWAQIYSVAEVYWIPNINPDGYIFTRTNRMWRKTRRPNSGSTCIGTDPNRNYPFGWGNPGASTDPCSETFRGSGPLSEEEIRTTTTSLKNLASRLVGFMDMHSYSQLWLASWGWPVQPTPDEAVQDKLGLDATNALYNVYGTDYVYGPISRVLYTASGGAVDYAYGELSVIHSYTPELRDKGSYGFLLPASQIQPSGVETNEAFIVWVNRCLGNTK